MSLHFSICFFGMQGTVWLQGVKWERRQQLTCKLCLLKYHLTWKDEFLILTACFDHIFSVDKDLHNLPKFWTTLSLAHLPVTVLPCGACQRSWSLRFATQEFILVHNTWQQHFIGGARRGQLHPTLQQEALKANYVGPDPVFKLWSFEVELW